MRFYVIGVAILLAMGCKKEECSLDIVVTVTNPDNEPMADAVVTARRASNPDVDIITCPGEGGVFTCTVPDEDLWKVYTEAVSFEPNGQELDVVAPEECDKPAAELSVQLQRESAV
jgi:hypothetical protein